MLGPVTCPKCPGEMQEGFLLETGLGSDPRPKWVSGEPSVNAFGGIQTSERDVRRVQTFRCIRCGFLEFYATEPG